MLETLATERIMAVTEEILQEPDSDPEVRFYSSNIPEVPAEDGEIMARIRSGYARAADIIQVDQKATIYQPEPVRLQQTSIPKFKHGFALTENMLLMMRRILQGLGTTRNRSAFDNYIANETRNLIQGIRDRKELVATAMFMDDLDYNRYGIILQSINWGMPSDVKITPAIPWTSTSATPIADIQTAQRYADETYQKRRNTIVMSKEARDNIYRTTEFQNLRPSYMAVYINVSNLPNSDVDFNTMLLKAMLKIENIVLYDKRTRVVLEDGSIVTQRFQPVNKVVLTDTSFLNNQNAIDFGNGVVLETMPGMVPHILEEFAEEQEGPVTFATAADAQGNPPGEVVWGVQRGFYRKHDELANSVITAWPDSVYSY